MYETQSHSFQKLEDSLHDDIVAATMVVSLLVRCFMSVSQFDANINCVCLFQGPCARWELFAGAAIPDYTHYVQRWELWWRELGAERDHDSVELDQQHNYILATTGIHMISLALCKHW